MTERATMDSTERFAWPTAASLGRVAPAPVPRGPEGVDPAPCRPPRAGRRPGRLGPGDGALVRVAGAAAIVVADTRQAPPRLARLRESVPHARFVAGRLDAAAAETLLADADLVAWSPGLSPVTGDTAAFHWACATRNVPVEGELTLFARALARLRETRRYAPKVAAITGTNGKTTTTRLMGELCAAAGLATAVCGNVSPAALDALREALEADGRGEPMPRAWVLELSSFQLALAEGFAPDAAAFLNVTQDHLDWHGTMDGYVSAKQRVFEGAGSCVHNRADRATAPPRERRAASFGLDAPVEPGGFGIVHDGGLRWLAEAVVDEEASPAGPAPQGRAAARCASSG
jgi:UDP-N-acetylmuramoylalanine--D-glutamate ligase